VVNVVVALPLALVVTRTADNAPAVVEKLTGAELSALPLMSKTSAAIVVDPPLDGTDAGVALTVTRPTAAVPTAILIAPAAPVVAPPDEAVIVAVPFESPASNLTRTIPLTSVSASDGRTLPRVLRKVTWVPWCGGVPAGSIT
jgi:hypothetical protein